MKDVTYSLVDVVSPKHGFRRDGRVRAYVRGVRPCAHCGIFDMARRVCHLCAQCFGPHWDLQWKAIPKVAAAIRRGALPPAKALACVDCGKPAHCYDHRDYSRPLDVVPVCRSCNVRRGPAKHPKAA